MKNLFKILLAVLFFVCLSTKGEAQTKLTKLEIGTPIAAELNVGDMHVYSINLNANAQFSVSVESAGIDIGIELISPTDEVLTRVNEFSSLNAVEQLIDVSESSGTYKLRIKPRDRNTIKGKYEIKLLSINTLLNNETYQSYLVARKTLMEGQMLEDGDSGSESENTNLFKAAIKKYKLCIDLYESIGDTHRVCELNSKIADIYSNHLYQDPESYEMAIHHFTVCLEKYKLIGNILGEATALNNVGYVLQLQKKYSYAFDYYKKSADISREILKDSYEEALTLYNIGILVNVQHKLQEALEYYEKAVNLLEEVKVFDLAGKMCNELLRIYKQQNQKQLVLETYDRQVKLYNLANNHDSHADTLAKKGDFARQIYAKDLSLVAYQASFEIYQKVGNKEAQARILNEIGRTYDQYGESYLSIDFYEKALLIAETTQNQELLVFILNGLGVAYSKIDRFEKAIGYLFQALEINKTETFQLVTLSNTGFAYSGLAEIEKALLFYEQALVLAKKLKDGRNESIVTNNIAIEQIKLGDLKNARNNLNLALAKFIEISDEFGQSSVLSRLGDIELREGNTEKALELLRRALEIRIKIGDSIGEIYTRNLIGIAENILGHESNATENINKALEISRKIFSESAELTTVYNLAKIEATRGNLKIASDLMAKSIEKVELVRSKFISKTFQSSYFATKQKYYELYIDILMNMHKLSPNQNYDRAAFFISEKMRARTLLELLGTESTENKKVGSNVEYESLNDQLTYLATQIIKLKNSSNNNTYEILRLEENLDKARTRLEILKTAIKNSKQVRDNRPLGIDEVGELLDRDTALIQYSLGDKDSYAWLITNTEKIVFTLPSQTKIEKLAEKIYFLLTERNRDEIETLKDSEHRIKLAEDEYLNVSSDLFKIVILPMKAHLSNKKRLIISPDKGLHIVPFAALSYNSKFLVQQYELVVIPSVSSLSFIRQTKSLGVQKIAVFADPIFNTNDPRIGGISNEKSNLLASQTKINNKRGSIREFNFARLEGTMREAESIKKFFPKQSQFFLGPKAKKEVVQNLRETGLSLHFGTHSLVFHDNPQLSCVVFNLIDEQGHECPGFLTIEDILRMKIAPELVTLSSCQSAKGKEIPGEGVISLTRAFFYIGARRVVSSLWSVDDDSTAQLMSDFYKNISNGLMPSSALRQAQIAMLGTRQYKSPYYWAAFQLQGEWK